MVAAAAGESQRIQLMIELLINLRVLGQDRCIPDRREKKGDIEALYDDIEGTARTMLDAVPDPSSTFIYYAREVLKKLPIRQGAEETIEEIRAAAEEFEEARTEDDPLRNFAGDLRKEVHRRLSPKIIGAYVVPYLELALHGNPAPIVEAGYVALPHFFSAEDEDRHFVELAQELLERLNYLWNYESGNLAAVKRQIEQNIGLFERCFLRAEVQGFLALLTPANLAKPHLELDLLKRLASFKHFLRESQREGRIGLYDFILLDLSLGRLVFLLANDLTNNHFAEVAPRNLRDALAVIRELLNISSIKGLAIGEVERYQEEIDGLRESSMYDFVKAKRLLGSICAELQRYLQSDIIDAMTGVLTKVLEEYEVPTSRLSDIKTHFFNNFIRRTQIHVLSEFAEKAAVAVDRELARQTDGRRLHADFERRAKGQLPAPGRCVASTWADADEKIRPTLGGKGNSIIDMAELGLNVPPAFVLGFPFFSECLPDGSLGEGQTATIDRFLGELQERSGRVLGDPERPLLVSVRSGAATSMPGLMATILNVGWSPAVRRAMERRRGEALTASLYGRFLENCLAALALAPDDSPYAGRRAAASANSAEPRGIASMEACLAGVLGRRFISEPRAQLFSCIELVYHSRRSRVVREYSRALASEPKPETAVTVQRLAFGNLNERSLSGVLITRNPITGDDELFGEFKRTAQGEEVVMGSAGTEPVSLIDPGIAAQLERAKKLLIAHYRQDLDLEFTVEDGTLYFLQARSARLGAFAQLVAETDFAQRGLIGLGEYRDRLDRLEMAYASAALPRADFRMRRWNPPLTVGVAINGGVVSGTLILSEDRLKQAEARRESVVYFANSTKPTDFTVMNGAHAIVTVYPGRTSHAAITAMSMNKPCIVGCADVDIDHERRTVTFNAANGATLREGERVTVDGNSGAVYRGIAPISEFFLPLASASAAARERADSSGAAAAVRGLIDAELARLGDETDLRRAGLGDVASFGGGRVLVRIDANIRLGDGAAADEYRLTQIAAALSAILDRGGTPVACSHLGDPGAGRDSRATREEISRDFSLRPIAAALAPRFPGRFVFHETSVAASGLLIGKRDIVPGSVNLLENLRFATGERDNDEAFARALAELSDGWYVNDAFNVCHRRHASITGAPKFAARRLAGPLVEGELAALEGLLDGPEKPFAAVFAGGETNALFGVMAALLPRIETLAILVEPGEIQDFQRGSDEAEPMVAESAVRTLKGLAPGKVIESGIGPDDPDACAGALAARLESAKTILWFGSARLARPEAGAGDGPAGPALATATASLHAAIKKGVRVIVCSEEDRGYAAPPGLNLHISSGPRAFTEYLERMSLPGITALDPSGRRSSPG